MRGARREAAGNYVLQLTDENSGDDPPYNIEINGSISASSGPTVPEPSTFLLFGACLLGLPLARRRLLK